MSETGSARLRGVQLAVRTGLAAALSAAIALAMDLEYPIYAFLAAIIVTDLTPLQSRLLGLRRLLATALGALSGAVVSVTLPSSAWTVGLGIFVTIFLSQQLQLRSGAKVAGYICAITVIHFGPEPWTYAFHRFVETALGMLVAWSLSMVPMLFDFGGRVPSEDAASAPWYRLDVEPVGPATITTDMQLALRAAVAAALAVFVAQQLKLEYPIFACIASVITTDLAPARSRDVGWSRVVATLIGAVGAAVFALALPANPWAWGGAVLITMVACQALHSHESAKVAACVCGIGMLMHGGEPGWFAYHRVLETGLGVAIAVLVSHVPKLMKAEAAPQRRE